MAVGAEKSFARNAVVFKMQLMANTVSGLAEQNSVPLSNAFDKSVIVCIFKTCLQGIVVDIGNGKLRLNFFYLHCLKLKIHHCTGRILCQRLINFYRNFAAGCQRSGNQVIFQYFVC